MTTHTTIRGRFAPSPTGLLHFGSLVTALGSYADAKSRGGEWLVRIEDVDETRAIPGMADKILRQLDAFGLHWDGEVIYQSQRKERYQQILSALLDQQRIYPCTCTRKQIAAVANVGLEGPIYPGTCRNGANPNPDRQAWRLKVDAEPITVNDRICGQLTQNLSAELGDFVVKRADGFTAYQLAVVIDDADQGINSVVRGQDLWLSTPRQCYLQRLLGFPTPEYAHLPLALTPDGKKISKSDAAQPIDQQSLLSALSLRALKNAWQFLRQDKLEADTTEEFFQQAFNVWQPERLSPSNG